MQNGAHVDCHNSSCNTALILASYLRYTEVAKLLINANANLDLQNHNGCTALIYASDFGHVEASDFGHVEIVELLIAAGANLDLKTHVGYTALKVAKKDEIKTILRAAKAELKRCIVQ